MRSLDQIFEMLPELTAETAIDQCFALLPQLTDEECSELREALNFLVGDA